MSSSFGLAIILSSASMMLPNQFVRYSLILVMKVWVRLLNPITPGFSGALLGSASLPSSGAPSGLRKASRLSMLFRRPPALAFCSLRMSIRSQ